METQPIETIAQITETIAETAETVAETIAATIPETVPAATQVIEIVETTDYNGILNAILVSTQNSELLLGYLSAFALFAVVVCLCYFCYRFFRIFF